MASFLPFLVLAGSPAPSSSLLESYETARGDGEEGHWSWYPDKFSFLSSGKCQVHFLLAMENFCVSNKNVHWGTCCVPPQLLITGQSVQQCTHLCSFATSLASHPSAEPLTALRRYLPNNWGALSFLPQAKLVNHFMKLLSSLAIFEISYQSYYIIIMIIIFNTLN